MKILNESSIDYTIPEMEVTGGGGGWGVGERRPDGNQSGNPAGSEIDRSI